MNNTASLMDSPALNSERWTGVDYCEEKFNVKRNRCNTALYPSHGCLSGFGLYIVADDCTNVPDLAGRNPQRCSWSYFRQYQIMRFGNARKESRILHPDHWPTSLTAYTCVLPHSRCQAWALWDRETRRVADLLFFLLRSNGMIKQAYPRILWTCKSSRSAYSPGLTLYQYPNLSTLRHLSDSPKLKWPIRVATDPRKARRPQISSTSIQLEVCHRVQDRADIEHGSLNPPTQTSQAQ